MTSVTHAGRPVIEARQTSLGLYVTAKEAYDVWQADPDGVAILDVRTPEEWVFTGHAPMATNIPFAFLAYVWDEERQSFPWELNPDFVDLVKARFAPDATILLTCRSGWVQVNTP
jgi:rhodanese-related sulfurtransferase